MTNKYLFIFEDGTLTVSNTIPQEIIDAAKDGLYDIVDMELGIYSCDGEIWEQIDII